MKNLSRRFDAISAGLCYAGYMTSSQEGEAGVAKSKYDTHVLPNLDKIEEWAKAGATAKEIAGKLNIAYSTFRKYLDDGEKGDERYSALSAAFVRACEVPDDEVEAALFKLATGYTVSLAKTFKVKRVDYDPETGRKIGEHEELVVGYDETHVPANAQAQMFWLANRRPDRWEYKPEKKDDEAKGGGVVLLAPVLPEPVPPEDEEVAQP